MFSVLLPVHNHREYLTEAVLSAVNDPLVREIVAADDGSSDDSAALLGTLARAFAPKLRNLTLEPARNLGAHATLNRLAEAASSEWLAVLNSDDAFAAGRFALVEQASRRGPFDFAFGDIEIMDGAGRPLGVKRTANDPEYPFPGEFSVADMLARGDFLDLLSNQNWIATTSNLVFRKELWKRIGGFGDYRYVHDWDFALRACMLGKGVYVPHPFTVYRIHVSNTIRESSERVDAECRELFERFERDFPRVRERRLWMAGRAGNRHANPEPLPRNSALSIHDHENAWLAFAVQDLDFVAVSHSFDGKIAGTIARAGSDTAAAPRGRAARLLGEPEGDHALPGNWRIGGSFPPRAHPMPLPPSRATKPVIFVLPALFAVGGVERNAVDVMSQLRGEYDFVVITVEPPSPERGSLRKEALEAALAFHDLAELAPPDLFETMLVRLRDIYSPVAVWICNGSPWQCGHAEAIRDIFARIPIVDQQVYDTEIGWITRFHEPGIRSADRFIATNSRIRDTFIERYRLPAERIDLIYPAVNLGLIGPLETVAAAGAEFVWIGRLTVQKRPIEFLRFAEIVKDEARFAMIGDGELAGECDAFIARHRLANVRRIPFSARVSEVLRACAGQVITSKWEGLPIAMLEALAMGLPVFSTDVGDIRMVLEQYANGAIGPDASDPEAFAAAWREWKRELPAWRERAWRAAPAIRERFGGPAAAGLYRTCWRRAIEQFHPAR